MKNLFRFSFVILFFFVFNNVQALDYYTIKETTKKMDYSTPFSDETLSTQSYTIYKNNKELTTINFTNSDLGSPKIINTIGNNVYFTIDIGSFGGFCGQSYICNEGIIPTHLYKMNLKDFSYKDIKSPYLYFNQNNTLVANYDETYIRILNLMNGIEKKYKLSDYKISLFNDLSGINFGDFVFNSNSSKLSFSVSDENYSPYDKSNNTVQKVNGYVYILDLKTGKINLYKKLNFSPHVNSWRDLSNPQIRELLSDSYDRTLRLAMEKQIPQYVKNITGNYNLIATRSDKNYYYITPIFENGISYSFPGFYGYKSTTGWKLIFSGQDVPKCSDLDKYKFPKTIEDYCINDKGIQQER